MFNFELASVVFAVAMVGLFLWERRTGLAAWRDERGISMMQGVILFGVILVALAGAIVVLTRDQSQAVSAADSYTNACGLDNIQNGTLPAGCSSA